MNVAAFLRISAARLASPGFWAPTIRRSSGAFSLPKGLMTTSSSSPAGPGPTSKILDQPNKRITDINLPGLPFSPENLASLKTVIDQLAADHDWFVLSGGAPAGTPDTVYAEMVADLRCAVNGSCWMPAVPFSPRGCRRFPMRSSRT